MKLSWWMASPQAGSDLPSLLAAALERSSASLAATAGRPYGRNFKYSESMLCPGGSPAVAAMVGLVFTLLQPLQLLALLPPVRVLSQWVVQRVLGLAPGRGPPRRVMEKGHFTTRLA